MLHFTILLLINWCQWCWLLNCCLFCRSRIMYACGSVISLPCKKRRATDRLCLSHVITMCTVDVLNVGKQVWKRNVKNAVAYLPLRDLGHAPPPFELRKNFAHGQCAEKSLKLLSDFKAKMHQIRFQLGLCPRPHWGSLQDSPDPLAGLRGVQKHPWRHKLRKRSPQGGGQK